MKIYWKFLVCSLLIVFLLPCLVMAQRGVPVTERARPDYDANGIQAGAFIIEPELKVGTEYNDNIYATKVGDKESDFIFLFAPAVYSRSNWSVHSLGLGAELKAGLYASESDENFVDGRLFLDGRMDVSRGSFLVAYAGIERLHEDRTDPDTQPLWDEPGIYYRGIGSLNYQHGIGRFSVNAGTGVSVYDYRSVDRIDGATDDQDDRDRNIYNVNARLTYNMHPDVSPFITTRYDWRRYDASDVERDSEGTRIGIGTGFDLGGVTSMEVYAGYMHQNYDDRSNISGFWYGLDLLWNPTQLTSVQASAMSSIKETTLGEASGIDAIDASLRVDHELLRNLLLGAFIGYTRNDYENVDLTEEFFSAGPRVTYLWNRNFSAEAGYTYREKDSDVRFREYTQNLFTVSVTGRF